MHQTVPFSTFISSPIAWMKIYFFCKTIPIHSEYARTKLHIGKNKSWKFRRNSFKHKEAPAESLFLFTFHIFLQSRDSKIYPTHLIPTAGAHGRFWFEIIQFTLFYLIWTKIFLKYWLKLIYVWNLLASIVWRRKIKNKIIFIYTCALFT